MRKALRCGFERLEILGKNDAILRVRNNREAADFLKPFCNDPINLAILRNLVDEHFDDPHRLTTEQILEKVGVLLVSGRIKILRSIRAGGARNSAQEETHSQNGSASPPPGNTSWIEINLRDESGQPVAGKRYRIKLPDGSTQEGTLDDFGHAEYYSINQGKCQVSFPDLNDDEWGLLQR
jgi:hypothetical protein